MKNRMFFIATLWLAISVHAAVFDITAFGAKGDGRTVNTGAIQQAIDAAATAGGCVLIPSGEFVTGALLLKSNVELYLESGAVLKGSPNLADYLLNGVPRGIIYAFEQRNIAITGHGVIDGNGTIFFDPQKPHWGPDFDRLYTRQGEAYMDFANGVEDGPIAYDDRPGMMVVLVRCEQVTIQNIILRDSPSWTFRIGDCDGVLVHGITILNNLLVPNSDGIHCPTTRNLRISDCDIRAGDDAIIVTGFGGEIDVGGDDSRSELAYGQRRVGNKTGFAENVVVTNCTLESRSSGIRVGYGQNPIRNCTFSNLVIHDSNRGLGVFARDAGSISNILFTDIVIQTRLHTGHWWGNGEPIHVSAIAQNKNVPVGGIANIRFENIIAQSEAGILLYGDPEQPLQNILLKDVQLKIVSGAHTAAYGGNFDLRPITDLKDGIFSHDIPGIFAQDVEGLTLDAIHLTWGSGLPPYFTHGIQAESVNDLCIDDFNGSAAPNATKGEAVFLRNCRRVKK
jgi:polygalacturonase